MAKKKSKRLDVTNLVLDISTLDDAYRRFRILANDESRDEEIREAMKLATRITNTLLNVVGATYDLRVFLHDIMGGRLR